jgi:Ca2+-binding EF-hand superfamily protein
MTAGDFKRFVKKYIEKAADHEVDSLFKHFASAALAGLANTLTFADFTEAFGREVQEASLQFTCSIEDIIKPLSTKIQKFNVNVSLLFEKYDKNHNRRLSADELASALQKDMKIVLAEDEIMAIRQYFKNRHNSTEIGELDFIALINTKFERVFDEPEAKRSLALIKQRVYGAQGRTAQMVCQEFDTEGLRKLSLRNFKHALHSTRALTPYQVDNLTKYLDQENDGFISIDRFDVEIRGAPNHNSSNPLAQSFGGHSSSASGKRTFK